MKQLAILISGNGSNLQSLIDWEKQGMLLAHIAIVISDNVNAYGLKRAKQAGITTKVINYANYTSNEEAEKEINEILPKNAIDLIISAGYMRILTASFVSRWYLKLINLHPSLLPSFPVFNAIEEAFNFGVKVTGVSTRFAESKLNAGLIILQETVKISNDDTINSLTNKIHNLEHEILPKTVNIVASNNYKILDRKVILNSE